MTRLSVFLAVTHLLGTGHLTRIAALGRALAKAGHTVTLVTGGRPLPILDATGLRLVQLPPVHCVGTDFRTLLAEDGHPVTSAMLDARRDQLVEAFRAASPDVVVTELFPFGRRQLAAEFEALLDVAVARTPRPAILCSVRDILNPPSKQEKAAEVLERLGRAYDAVLVHGDPDVVPLGLSWPPDPTLDRRLVYTGYIASPHQPAEAGGDGADEVVVTASGGASGLPLYRAAVAAAGLKASRRRWRILVGHGVEQADFARLVAEAPARCIVERARPDFRDLLDRAAVVVSQAGYNTVVEIVQAQARAVLVPFDEGNEKEQTLRASVFGRLGLADTVPAARLTPERLLDAVEARLDSPRPIGSPIELDGLEESIGAIEVVAHWAAQRHQAWRRLDGVLDNLRMRGAKVALWWRDDDAVAATPALDRLLSLRARAAVPLSLAVIPAHADAALARRLASEPDVCVLQHGFAHANQAPPGAKKIELGHCPMPLMLGEIELGAQRLERLFGRAFRPVMVPPWNRIDPALPALLPDLGIRGLSTFKDRARREPAPGLVQVNTHWDPIAWRGSGGLGDPAALLDQLSDLIESRADFSLAAQEPIGLLTHHLVHDGWIWRFLDDILDRLTGSDSVVFVDPWAREA
jgi:predicted glycosyltransferase